MSLKLFFAPGACSFVPHAMLELAGVEFEPVSVKLHKGEQRSAEYLAMNPRGQVPVLVDGGEVITQIVTILLHLDAKLPEAGILPALKVEIEQLAEDRFRIAVEDNGPGIVRQQMDLMAGLDTLLASLRAAVSRALGQHARDTDHLPWP